MKAPAVHVSHSGCVGLEVRYTVSFCYGNMHDFTTEQGNLTRFIESAIREKIEREKEGK